ncbi:MAG: DUF3368 domain-containing protein [Acidobacteria bacterium]|nr:DUF3368 domain-containing protein [Acidobacteriota bacterium]
MYQGILVPGEVLAELTAKGAPPQVCSWAQTPPQWLEIKSPDTSYADPALLRTGAGERAAILLAQQYGNALLIIDDAAGREEANRRGIPNTGTLGVLRAAASRDLLDLSLAITALEATNFRVSRSVLQQLLAEDSQRARRSET